MSELKSQIALLQGLSYVKYREVYLKSEADKVIAEKDEEIAELKKQVYDYELGLYVMQARAEKEARHDKYKRCLGMVDALTWDHNYLVDFVSSDFPNVRFKRNHRVKWIKKWLELAEKFKEEK